MEIFRIYFFQNVKIYMRMSRSMFARYFRIGNSVTQLLRTHRFVDIHDARRLKQQ